MTTERGRPPERAWRRRGPLATISAPTSPYVATRSSTCWSWTPRSMARSADALRWPGGGRV